MVHKLQACENADKTCDGNLTALVRKRLTVRRMNEFGNYRAVRDLHVRTNKNEI